MNRREVVQCLAAIAAAPILGCNVDRVLRPSFSSSTAAPITLIGAGDQHAISNLTGRARTAGLVKSVLDANPTAWAFNAGDLTPKGTAAELEYYHQTWGAFRDRTLFVIGNHDSHYTTPRGAPYYAYTGAPKYYARTLGAWRCYMLNCESAIWGGVDEPEQTAWLRADLAQHKNYHIMAIWHYPMWASVCSMNLVTMTWPGKVGPWWQALQEYGAEFIVCGHAHRYERFRRKLRNGTVSNSGIRQFLVGTGGGAIMGIMTRHPDSERLVVDYGVIRFDLHADHYNWSFRDQWGVVKDSGTQVCRKVLNAG
jgi:calcineurin-like phosphoesterase family protein